jgi:Bacterial SH3 domain
MSQSTIAGKSQFFSAATALSVVGLLVLPAPAQARPTFPLAPQCTDYKFTGDFALQQSNGARVTFFSNSQVAAGPADATGTGVGTMHGTVSGGVHGIFVDFTIRWNNGPRGHYTGQIDEFDFAHGNSVDEVNPESTATWDSTVPFGCMTPPAAPPPPAPAPVPAPAQVPAPAPAPAPATATVAADVDLYDAPGGNGNVIGMLKKGQQVQLQGACKANDWCQIVGQGWIWGNLTF